MRNRLPPPHEPTSALSPRPMRRTRARSPVIQHAEGESLLERKNKRRRSMVEEWELFEARNVYTGGGRLTVRCRSTIRDKSSLQIPPGLRGKKGIFARSITSDKRVQQVAKPRFQPEPVRATDWRDAWKSKPMGAPSTDDRPGDTLSSSGQVYPTHDAARFDRSLSELWNLQPGERSQAIVAPLRETAGPHRSFPDISPRRPLVTPAPEVNRQAQYSPSWSTFRTNLTSSQAPDTQPRRPIVSSRSSHVTPDRRGFSCFPCH